ncbi:EamA family transporter [Streptomyces sp. MJP52]|uniref:EamA family transporter n=1 Tax=Streptomyces sp. MJP52 TaxID=2940555 RepID=UPI0024737718|nr:EamA family transporter [Streptomyces sp. MJP52]MDH6226951.1 putative blue pigment (indigoidine) exporter [Streptomyces sp. MJP52]
MRRAAAATAAVTGLAQVLWGSTYVVTTEFLPPDRPLFTALARALPAGLLLLAVTRVLPRGDWWWRAAVLGVLNIGVFFPLLFLAAYRVPGGTAAVAGSVGPLLVAVLGVPLLAERVRTRTVVTGLAAVAGVALVMLPGLGVVDAAGTAAALAAAGAMSLGTVLGKRWGRPEGAGPPALAGWQLTVGGLVIAPLAAAVEGAPPDVDAAGAAGYAYLALVNTALAYWLWFRGVGRMGATSVTFLVTLSPLTATTLGWAFLGESLTAVQVTGMALALGATAAGQAAPRQRRPVPRARLPRARRDHVRR